MQEVPDETTWISQLETVPDHSCGLESYCSQALCCASMQVMVLSELRTRKEEAAVSISSFGILLSDFKAA